MSAAFLLLAAIGVFYVAGQILPEVQLLGTTLYFVSFGLLLWSVVEAFWTLEDLVRR